MSYRTLKRSGVLLWENFQNRALTLGRDAPHFTLGERFGSTAFCDGVYEGEVHDFRSSVSRTKARRVWSGMVAIESHSGIVWHSVCPL